MVGTGRLTLFALRRDRIRIPAWAVLIGAFIAYSGAMMPTSYPDAASLRARAKIVTSPSLAFTTGPGYGVDNYTFGALLANELLSVLAVGAALMSIFLVVRHTRTEEETGQAELIRAGAVGRYAPLTAGVLDVLVADAAVVLVVFGALVANDLEATDSLAMAVGVGLVGLVFGAVAAVTAQLGAHARTASGMAGAALGLAYVLRGIGDGQKIGGTVLSWMSPIGWAQQTRAFVDLRWWPLLLCLALAVALVTGACALVSRRDVGAGLVPARSGRADAHPSLLSPVGLSLRLERGSIIGWAVGLFVVAFLEGSLGQGIVDSFVDLAPVSELTGGATEDEILRGALAAFLGLFAMYVAVYAVISVNRLGHEEDRGRTGAVLATAVSRAAWLGRSVLATAIGSAGLLLVAGFGLGAGVATSVGAPGLIWDLTTASLAYVPLMLCFIGLAVVAYGTRSGTWWVWSLVVSSIVVGMFGPTLNLPQAVRDAAPFSLVPAVPSAALDVLPLAVMTAAAAALMTLGVMALRRRDLSA